MATFRLLALPAEIRNQIYMDCIGHATVDSVTGWNTPSHQKTTSKTGSLALSQTCKQIRKEYLSLWMSTVTVRIRLFRLGDYLQKFHPLNTHAHAKVHLLLPCNDYRSRQDDSFTDVTRLFRLMAQNPQFALTVGQAYRDHALALSEAHELQGLLRNISQKAQSFLDSIITVRLSMRRAGWDVSKSPPVVVKDAERPAVLFTFREHSTLPGEWPWYGAHDLNHESVLLWNQWMEERGASGLQRWQVEIAAQRGTKEATRWTTVGTS